MDRLRKRRRSLRRRWRGGGGGGRNSRGDTCKSPTRLGATAATRRAAALSDAHVAGRDLRNGHLQERLGAIGKGDEDDDRTIAIEAAARAKGTAHRFEQSQPRD